MKLVNFEFCNAKQLALGSLHPYFLHGQNAKFTDSRRARTVF